MGIRVYRVQDEAGRGPYAPGVSRLWTDTGHNDRNPDIFRDFDKRVLRAMPKRMFRGCAFRSVEQLRAWFSADEMTKLARLGYRIVTVEVDRILGSSERQLLVARRIPFDDGALTVAWPERQCTLGQIS